MKTLQISRLIPSLLISLLLLIGGACQQEGVDSVKSKEQAAKAASDNTQILAVTEAIMNATEGIAITNDFSGGRTSGGDHHDDDDDNNGDHQSKKCRPSISGSFSLDRSHTDSLIYSGVFIIDFGDGSSCDSANVRKGKVIDSITVIIAYHDSLVFSSKEIITFEGFWKDSIQVDGKFVIQSSSGNPTVVEAHNAMITNADGTFLTWNSSFAYVYEKRGSRYCRGKIMKIIEGSVTGTTPQGADFTATITKEIIYKRGCIGWRFVPVSGTVEVTTLGVASTIDYGDGTCDKDYTVTTAGVVEDRTFF